MNLSVLEFAAITERSAQTVRRWIRAGMPHGSATERGRVVLRITDILAAAEWLERSGATAEAHRARMATRTGGRSRREAAGPGPTMALAPGPGTRSASGPVSDGAELRDPLLEIPRTDRQWRGLLGVLRERCGFDVFRDARDATLGPGAGFDAAEAARVLAFFRSHVREVKGDNARQIMDMQRWQAAFLAALFGFRDGAGRRRFRKALLYVPRKNGKTTLVAGIGLLVLATDGEEGMEGYCAAEDRDQATIVWDVMKRMVELDPVLARMLRVLPSTRTIAMESTAGFLRAIPGDASGNHGSNPHLVMVDELHTQPDRELVDVLETGSAARSEPLSISMTTADFDRPSICNERYDYAARVRDGIVPDARFLPAIFEATASDDWRDPATWAKANPNLGVSIGTEYFRNAVREAEATPARLNNFLRLHLNLRTRQDVRWMDMDRWDACDGRRLVAGGPDNGREAPGAWRARTMAELEADAAAGRRVCFGGLDLSSTGDTTCLALLFTPRGWSGDWSTLAAPGGVDGVGAAAEGDAGWDGEGGGGGDAGLADGVEANPWVVLPYFFVPRERAASAGGGGAGSKAIDRAPYALWARIGGPGAMTMTAGNVVDYDAVIAAVVRARDRFGMAELAFDAWNATQVATTLAEQHGIPMVAFRQGFGSMSAPTKMLEVLTGRGAIDHGGNQVLRYQISCAQARTDESGNVKLDKKRSTERIDGPIALVMALGRAMANPGGNATAASVYETRGVLELDL